MKKIIRITRFITLKGNVLNKDIFCCKEGSKNIIVLRPTEANKHLPKTDLMEPKCEFEFNCTHLYGSIWCFEYQEKEAEEILNEKIKECFIKENELINEQLENLKKLSLLKKTNLKRTEVVVVSSEKFTI